MILNLILNIKYSSTSTFALGKCSNFKKNALQFGAKLSANDLFCSNELE
jgi:hypothetical protein